MTNEELMSMVSSYLEGDHTSSEGHLEDIRNTDRIAEQLTCGDYSGLLLGSGLLLVLIDIELRKEDLRSVAWDLRRLMDSLSRLSNRRLKLPLAIRKDIARTLLETRASVLLYKKYGATSDEDISDVSDKIQSVASKFYNRSRKLGERFLSVRDHGPKG